jgi:hypothetical protein
MIATNKSLLCKKHFIAFYLFLILEYVDQTKFQTKYVDQTKFQTEFQTDNDVIMKTQVRQVRHVIVGVSEVFSENETGESRDCTPVSGDPYL